MSFFGPALGQLVWRGQQRQVTSQVSQRAGQFLKDVAESEMSDFMQKKVKEYTGVDVKTAPPQTLSGFAASLVFPTMRWAAGQEHLQRDGVFTRAATVQNPPPQTQSYLSSTFHAAFYGRPDNS